MKRLLMGAAAMALAACGQTAESELTGRWEVQQIAGASLGEGVDVWIEIDHASGAVSGFTGCNDFTTTLSSFGSSASFAAVREASGECASAAAATDEARFLGVLPSVRRYLRRGKSLELLPVGTGSEALLRLRLAEEGGG